MGIAAGERDLHPAFAQTLRDILRATIGQHAVLAEGAGVVGEAQHLHAVAPIVRLGQELGDTVELRGPLGGWFIWRADQTQPIQLIAGGSGVVPFVAMVRTHSRTASSALMHLLYSLRTPDDAFFRDELSESSPTSPTTWHYTRTAPLGWPQATGRLTVQDLKRATLAPELAPLTYICGPTGFVETVARSLTSLGHSAVSIRTERFGGT